MDLGGWLLGFSFGKGVAWALVGRSGRKLVVGPVGADWGLEGRCVLGCFGRRVFLHR